MDFPSIKTLYIGNVGHVECKNNTDTSDERGNWDHLKNIKKECEQHRGAAENGHNGQCALIAAGANVKVQSFYRGM